MFTAHTRSHLYYWYEYSSSSIGTATLSGFWPVQLSLGTLSRKVFTECRCQRHVKPPSWRTDTNISPSSINALFSN